MKKYLKIIFIIILVLSIYHLIRDFLQTAGYHNAFTNVLHRSHLWCGQLCNYVTYPLDIAGIVIPAIVLKRNKMGLLGAGLLALMPLWLIFTLLP